MIDPNNNTDEAYESLDSMVIGEEADEGGWTLVPAGIYIFVVSNVQTERYEPGPNSKLPACWKVAVTLDVRDTAGNAGRVTENLFCTKKQAWKIKNLFVACGLVQRSAESFTPDWKGLLGHDGVCEIGVRNYKDRDGNDRQANEVKRFFDPEDGQEALAKASDGTATPATAPASATPAQSSFSFPGAK